MNLLKTVVRNAFSMTGKGLVSSDELELFRNLDPAALLYSQVDEAAKCLISPFLPYSKSQLAQDLFALASCGSKLPKYFVEFGATDGITLSNSWLLETMLGWEGVLAEPARVWHPSLLANRNCSIDQRCVAQSSGMQCMFLEVNETNGGLPEFSSMESYADNGDWASNIRMQESERYMVETISLNDLLDEYNSPGDIQFLSIDTEGSELDILKSFDFTGRKIRSICVEHNYQTAMRSAINALLTSHGYTQVCKPISKWDDWYLLKAY